MKVTVKIDGRTFVVQVGDTQSRPVVAMVDGERFEIWPDEVLPAGIQEKTDKPGGNAALEAATPGQPAVGNEIAGNQLTAPLPGVIDSIAVQPGDIVTQGQELLVIEAMKMKNVLRSPIAGEVQAIKVGVGQHVRHSDLLLEFVE